MDIPKDLKSLTSMRFFAALMIVVYHYFDIFGADFSYDFYKKFYLGVDFFFILSGFILFHVYSKSVTAGCLNIKHFYIKRLAKIYPVHFILTMILFALIVISGNVDQSATRSFLSHILLVHAWGFETSLNYNSQSWSISAEWFAYLIFPFLSLMILKFRKRPALILSAALGLFIAIWLSSSFASEKPVTEWTYYSILRIFPEFFLGMAVYSFLERFRKLPKAPIFFIFIVFLISVSFAFQAPDFVVVILFGAMIYALASIESSQPASVVIRVLSCRSLVWLGEISYCLYMIHFLMLLVILVPFMSGITLQSFFTLMPVYILGAFVAAALLYQFLEVPARLWIIKKFVT